MKVAYQALVSALLLGVLALQAAASFGRLHPTRYWPFLSYPMYNTAHHAGDTIPDYRLVAVFSDGREAPILEEDLHLDFWQFRSGPVEAALQGRRGDLQRDLAGWERARGGRVAAIRVENHPVILRENGVAPGPVEATTVDVSTGAS